MGKNIDATFIQSKMLNKSKGPAVHSLRAQADKSDYSHRMRKIMENTDNLLVRQAEVSEIIVEDGIIKGVKTVSGASYFAKAVVLCTGVYLKAMKQVQTDFFLQITLHSLLLIMELKSEDLRQVHRRELTSVLLIFQR